MDLHAFFNSEVKPTIGCTEPGAVAYAAAVAARRLPGEARSVHLAMSTAVYKNGRSVGIPGTDGLRGLAMAAALGAVGGDPDKGLMSLEGVSPEAVARAQSLIAGGHVSEEIVPDAPPMWTTVTLTGGGRTVSCTVARRHDHVEKLVVDGVTEVDASSDAAPGASDEPAWMSEIKAMDFQRLWDAAHSIDDDIARQMLDGARMNMEIQARGDGGVPGAGIGIGQALAKHRLEFGLPGHIKEAAGAASDLRMSGGDVTVMSSAGSGNHGIVAVIPVAMTARSLGSSDRALAEALALSHLGFANK